jgi:hypothetical protein
MEIINYVCVCVCVCVCARIDVSEDSGPRTQTPPCAAHRTHGSLVFNYITCYVNEIIVWRKLCVKAVDHVYHQDD